MLFGFLTEFYSKSLIKFKKDIVREFDALRLMITYVYNIVNI